MENYIDNNLNNEEPKSTAHAQDLEFNVLGLKIKWRGTIVFSILALSVLLNFFLVFKVMDTQKEIANMQQKMYERVIEEIKPKIEKIDENIQEANEKINNKLNEN